MHSAKPCPLRHAVRFFHREEPQLTHSRIFSLTKHDTPCRAAISFGDEQLFAVARLSLRKAQRNVSCVVNKSRAPAVLFFIKALAEFAQATMDYAKEKQDAGQ